MTSCVALCAPPQHQPRRLLDSRREFLMAKGNDCDDSESDDDYPPDIKRYRPGAGSIQACGGTHTNKTTGSFSPISGIRRWRSFRDDRKSPTPAIASRHGVSHGSTDIGPVARQSLDSDMLCPPLFISPSTPPTFSTIGQVSTGSKRHSLPPPRHVVQMSVNDGESRRVSLVDWDRPNASQDSDVRPSLETLVSDHSSSDSSIDSDPPVTPVDEGPAPPIPFQHPKRKNLEFQRQRSVHGMPISKYSKILGSDLEVRPLFADNPRGTRRQANGTANSQALQSKKAAAEEARPTKHGRLSPALRIRTSLDRRFSKRQSTLSSVAEDPDTPRPSLDTASKPLPPTPLQIIRSPVQPVSRTPSPAPTNWPLSPDSDTEHSPKCGLPHGEPCHLDCQHPAYRSPRGDEAQSPSRMSEHRMFHYPQHQPPTREKRISYIREDTPNGTLYRILSTGEDSAPEDGRGSFLDSSSSDED